MPGAEISQQPLRRRDPSGTGTLGAVVELTASVRAYSLVVGASGDSPGLFGKGGFRGLLKLRRALIDADRVQDLEAEAPEVVMLDDRSRAILDRAREFAAEEREDPDAVQELVELAGRHRRALELAALGARQFGAHRQHPIPNRAHRLLQAALAGTPVEPPARGDEVTMTLVEALLAMEPQAQWTELISREPRLDDLADKVRAGHYGRSVPMPGQPPRDPEERQELLSSLGRERKLRETLAVLVGPTSDQADPLLHSETALNVAWLHLRQLREEA
jgi:hypothetical protein